MGAHEGIIWSLDWHPLGHTLASASADGTTRFWARQRPGDTCKDKYVLGLQAAEALGISTADNIQESDEEEQDEGRQQRQFLDWARDHFLPRIDTQGTGVSGSRIPDLRAVPVKQARQQVFVPLRYFPNSSTFKHAIPPSVPLWSTTPSSQLSWLPPATARRQHASFSSISTAIQPRQQQSAKYSFKMGSDLC